MDDMITGRGQLKIDGETLTISLTVPKGPCAAEAVLPDAQRVANQITDMVERRVRAAGAKISCAKGCGACCRQLVPVSPVEARHLAAVVEKLPPERAAAVRARFAAARAQMADAGVTPQGHPDDDREAYRAFGLQYFRQGVPCPFLEDESCSIHPDRPLVCREYLVTSPPEACGALGAGRVTKVAVPLRLWAVFARSASPDGTLEWMPLIDALDHAATHPHSPADRTGPERVQALLAAMQK